MNEQSIFLAALEIEDARIRTDYLDQACGGNKILRRQVESLLEEHERSGEFLSTPALEQMKEAGIVTNRMNNDVTERDEQHSNERMEFSFLEPSNVPGSLGRLGHYDIQEFIGHGGFGTVFKAFDQKLHRLVAIKVLNPEMAATSPARKRFLREARATAAIRHENVVSLYAVEDTPIPFLVMEFIDGKTLQQLIDETGPLDLQTILRIGQKIADGLEAAHQKGLIHRDLTPANILIESGTGQVKVTDFGLVRVTDDASESQSGVIAGTPLYMSPEQAQGHKLDSRSDLFSLGSVLYLMCSGRPPFRAPNILAVLKRIVDEEPRDIQEIIPEVPDWLVAIVNKLHAKDPANRFATAQEVSDLLTHPPVQEVHWETPVADPPSVVSRVGRPIRQWMKFVGMILVLLLSFGVAEATGVTNFKGSIIRFFSPQGTLIIEVDDPEVSVAIDDEELVITGAGAKEIRVKPGRHRVTASKDGTVLQQELVSVSRNGRQVVRVSREEQPEKASFIPDRRAAEYVLSIGGKVRINDDHPLPYGTNPEIKSLADLPDDPFRLTHVVLDHNNRVSDDGLASFRGTKNLRAIFTEFSTKFSNDGLAYLSENRNLQVLDLWGTKITGAGLGHFRDCPELRDIRVGYTPMTAEDLSVLETFSNLNNLGCLMLTETGADDSTLALLSAAPHLNQLNLKLTDITDAGLVHLEQHRELHTVEIVQTRVTRDGYLRLSRALPRCRVFWNESEVVGSPTSPNSLWNPTADQQAFFDKVARLPPSEQAAAVGNKLAEVNPGFNDIVSPRIEGSQVVGFRFNSDRITNLWPVRALPHLRELQCDGSFRQKGKLSDLKPLVGMKLVRLDCRDTRVANLEPLKGMPLARVDISRTNVADLSPLTGMKLVHLECFNTSVTDLSPVKGMPLRYLNCFGTRVSDLSPLTEMPLTDLDMARTKVSNLSPLAGLPLKRLQCYHTLVSDLSPLEGARLEMLRTQHSLVSDLSPLKGMPLRELTIEETLVSDLSVLASLPLKQLSLDLPRFDETPEKRQILRSVKQLGKNSNEFREAKIFWQDFDSRKKAAEEYAAEHSQQPPAEQVKAILKKLRTDNSNVGIFPIVKDGAITEAMLTLDANSHDISSLRMLGSLKKLTLKGGPGSLDLSPINSLPVETLECSQEQALRNRNVLESMATLTTINQQPAQEYLASLKEKAP